MSFIVQTSIGQNKTVISAFNEVTSVAASTSTTVLSYTVVNDAKFISVVVSGTNIATYEVYINDILQDKQRTYFGGSLNLTFEFYPGLNVLTSDIISIKVIHERPYLGNFNARLQLLA